MKFLPTFSKSQLVHGEFYGVDLSDRYYRENNIQKINSLLAAAYESDCSGYLFEIIDDELVHLMTQKMSRLDLGFKYAKLTLPTHTLLLAFTHYYNAAQLSGILNEFSSDFTLLEEFNLSDDSVDIEAISFRCYQLGQHTVVGKEAKKAKEFTACDLTDDEKRSKLVLKKVPVLQVV